ncbi:unnamed protein product [Prorocentrum cordatum]|uniref:Uncharacterized protein n=1 Tax=Prorocentrum cordatum TaxID=2364126 RepID=A0ABN9W5F6_9DINO|nr:unnamed protein product [Polarella glacialis]
MDPLLFRQRLSELAAEYAGLHAVADRARRGSEGGRASQASLAELAEGVPPTGPGGDAEDPVAKLGVEPAAQLATVAVPGGRVPAERAAAERAEIRLSGGALCLERGDGPRSLSRQGCCGEDQALCVEEAEGAVRRGCD